MGGLIPSLSFVALSRHKWEFVRRGLGGGKFKRERLSRHDRTHDRAGLADFVVADDAGDLVLAFFGSDPLSCRGRELWNGICE